MSSIATRTFRLNSIDTRYDSDNDDDDDDDGGGGVFNKSSLTIAAVRINMPLEQRGSC